MNHLLSSFRSFKSSLVPEATLNRRKSLAFIRMFKKFNFRMSLMLILIPVFPGVLKAQIIDTPKTHADSLTATFTSAALIDSATISNYRLTGTASNLLVNGGYYPSKIYPVAFYYGNASNKILFWTTIPDHKTGKTIFHVKKSQIRWINDSTAVITPYHKPKRRKYNGIYATGQSCVGSKTIKR